MIVSKEHIQQYLPHRPPFLMIDGLLSATPERFESVFEITQDNVLVAEGEFQESGLMENIAQTCAASFGYLDREQGGEPKIGFIGAISRVHVYALAPLSSTINTVVEPTHRLGNIVMVSGKSYTNGELLLECEMKIVISE
ncbi:MAG TPA: hypothetical protein VGN64_10010 [Dyadobacter sp.]|jgi:predicted hotdog family 3-hydroxylacyl-ACP dehydratase|nr:hypothetical protein [Dyadobacter sp.]